MKIKKISLYYNSTSATVIIKNPVLHSRTKYIKVIKELVQDGSTDIQYVSTEQQLDDLFTKPLGFEWFSKLQFELTGS